MQIIEDLLITLCKNGEATIAIYNQEGIGDIDIRFCGNPYDEITVIKTIFLPTIEPENHIFSLNDAQPLIELIVKYAILGYDESKIKVRKEESFLIQYNKKNRQLTNQLFQHILIAIRKYNINRIMLTKDIDIITNTPPYEIIALTNYTIDEMIDTVKNKMEKSYGIKRITCTKK